MHNKPPITPAVTRLFCSRKFQPLLITSAHQSQTIECKADRLLGTLPLPPPSPYPETRGQFSCPPPRLWEQPSPKTLKTKTAGFNIGVGRDLRPTQPLNTGNSCLHGHPWNRFNIYNPFPFIYCLSTQDCRKRRKKKSNPAIVIKL